MSIWFELMALSLAAYAVGLLLGWVLWGKAPQPFEDEPPQESAPSDARTPQAKAQ